MVNRYTFNVLSLFVVLISETDGIDINKKITPCEEHKQRLIQATSIGFLGEHLWVEKLKHDTVIQIM